jgi:hypothetical protein
MKMGIDYYSCEVCGEAFPDVIDYGHCGNCEEVLCADCRDEMGKKYGVLGEEHEKADIFGEDAPVCCDACNKPTVNKEMFNKVMYALTKSAARSSFVDFLESWDIPHEEYDKIREYLKEIYGIKTYV